jgi:hypothetical protein
MAFIEELISNLTAQGFFDYILPFLLVFFIAFAIFEQTKIVGEKKGINAVIAMLLALFILYFARIFQVGRFLSFFTGKAMMTLIILIFTFMITTFVFNVFSKNGMIKKEKEWQYALIIFAASMTIILLLLQSSPDTWKILFGADFQIDWGTIIAIAGVAGVIGLIGWVMGG